MEASLAAESGENLSTVQVSLGQEPVAWDGARHGYGLRRSFKSRTDATW